MGLAWASGAGGARRYFGFKGFRLGATPENEENASFLLIYERMRSSKEVILPKMSFRLGATAAVKRSAFFL